MKRRLGFTLVEMVIVIAVIGILATVLVPTFGGIIDRANESTDVQTAGNLTTLIAMYGVEHKIETETDIAKAINEGKGDPEFYQNLKAKSAKQGNCFWYEYSTGQVVVGTLEEIAKRAAEQPATTDGDATVDGGLRSYVVPGYILMGHNADNKLLDVLCDLESPGIAKYSDGFAKLYQLVADNADNATAKAALDAFVAKVKQTVILTSEGLFLPAGVTTVDKVYIPFGTVTLGNASLNVHVVSVDANGNVTVNPGSYDSFELVDSFKLQLPLGTQIGADVLDLQRNDSENNPFMTGSDEIHVNATESELGNYFFADSTDAVIVLPNGDRYILNDAKFVKLTATEEVPVEGVAAPALGELNSFGIGVEDGVDPNYALSKNFNEQDKTFDLFVSADHLGGSITLSANNFQGTLDGQAATLPIRKITVGVTNADKDTDCAIAHSTRGLTSVITNFEDGDTITVSARDITYTYKVKVVDVEKITIVNVGANKTSFNNKYDLPYQSAADTWNIKYSIGYTYKDTGVDLNTTVNVNSGLFDPNPAAVDAETAALKLKEMIAGERSDTLKLTCRNEETEEISVSLYQSGVKAFNKHTNVVNMANKNDRFVIGTEGADVTLGQLFATNTAVVNSNFEIKGITLNVTGAPSDFEVDNWEAYSILNILPSNLFSETVKSVNLTITLSSYRGESESVEVTIVNGAYNVTSAAEWAAATGNIAVLNPITINITETKESKMTTASLGYVKSIGSGTTIYGNLQKIEVTGNFKIYQAAINYFITVDGGTIDNLILVGPDYGETVSITGSLPISTFLGTSELGDAKSKGTHVAAVIAKNATIKNSFISGFRAPVTANGGTVTITNTVLNKGNYANIDVAHATTLNLTNVTTIQYKTNNNIGAGIAFKYNSKTSTVSATGLNQLNYYTEADVLSICNAAKNVFGSLLSGLVNVDMGNHLETAAGIIGGHGDRLHVGMIEIGMDLTVDVVLTKKTAKDTPVVNLTEDFPDSYDIAGPYDAPVSGTGITDGSHITAKLHGEKCSTGCNCADSISTDVTVHINKFLDGQY